jgi:hypothetical protein
MKRWILVFLVACGGSSKPNRADQPKLADSPRKVYSCQEAAAAAGMGGPMGAVLEKHCTSESWGEDTRYCMGNVTSLDQMQPCIDSLNDDQRRLLGQDMSATFSSQ